MDPLTACSLGRFPCGVMMRKARSLGRQAFVSLSRGQMLGGGAGLSGESAFPFLNCWCSPVCICLWPGLWTQETSLSAALPARWSGRQRSRGRAQLRRLEEAQIPAQPAFTQQQLEKGQGGTGRSPTTGRLSREDALGDSSRRSEAAPGSVPDSHQRFLPRMLLRLGTRVLQGQGGCGQIPACTLLAPATRLSRVCLSGPLGGVFCLQCHGSAIEGSQRELCNSGADGCSRVKGGTRGAFRAMEMF